MNSAFNSASCLKYLQLEFCNVKENHMNINSLLQTGAPSRLIVDSIFYSAIGKSMTVNTTEKYLS